MTTIEGLAQNGELHPVQAAFHECHALQCGFCTPGMIMQSVDLLNDNPNPTEDEIRDGLEGNLCRCTGYHNIVQRRADRGRTGGERMTATEERPGGTRGGQGDRPRPAPQGGPAADHRPHPLDRQHPAPGMLHLAMVRSPFAHAKITSIDTAAAKAAPNVVAVVTGTDIEDVQGVLINAWPITPEQMTPGTPADRRSTGSRFAGEIVAVVVARTAAEARDAAELVDVDYEELPAALDLKEAAEDKVLAHPDLGTNKSALWVFDSAEAGTGGNVEDAIEQGARRRHRDRAGVPPAAADPGVHGASLRGGRPHR